MHKAMLFTEGILWYLFLVDAVAYNFLAWTSFHKQQTHWASAHFPLNKLLGFLYLFLIIWLGFALYRMQLLGFYIQ